MDEGLSTSTAARAPLPSCVIPCWMVPPAEAELEGHGIQVGNPTQLVDGDAAGGTLEAEP